MNYGYCRVSTKTQHEDRQLIALNDAGVETQNIFFDQQSGKDFNRPGYKRLCRKIKPGDVLFVTSIDRLGRNYDEIIAQWRYLTRKKMISIVVLDMPLLDTRQGKDITGELISDIVLQLLSYVAHKEREYIRQRQAEGIAAAKAKGIHFGRPQKPLPENFHEVYIDWKKGNISGTQAATRCKMPVSTFRYRAKHYEYK